MIKVITRSRDSYAEVILHDGADACAVGGEAYTDNSRNSVVCAEHRKEYQRRQRGKKNGQKRENAPDAF